MSQVTKRAVVGRHCDAKLIGDGLTQLGAYVTRHHLLFARQPGANNPAGDCGADFSGADDADFRA